MRAQTFGGAGAGALRESLSQPVMGEHIRRLPYVATCSLWPTAPLTRR